MTVPNATRSVFYAGDTGSPVFVFPYAFKILDQAHLVVLLTDAAGVDTPQVLATDYTVDGVQLAAGGDVTMIVAPLDNETLKIERIVPLTQLIDLPNQGNYFPETIEDGFDYGIMASQQLAVTVAAAAAIGLPTIYTTATRPIPSVLFEGVVIRVIDAATSELRQACMLSADGSTYTWVTYATGGA